MKTAPFLLLVCLPAVVHAEVFKCTDKFGKASYQASPCRQSDNEKQLTINKLTPVQAEEAQAKLQALQVEYEENKARQIDAEKQALKQQNRAAMLEAIKQNTIAKKQLLEAEQKQQELLNQQIYSPVMLIPHAGNPDHKTSQHEEKQPVPQIHQTEESDALKSGILAEKQQAPDRQRPIGMEKQESPGNEPHNKTQPKYAPPQ